MERLWDLIGPDDEARRARLRAVVEDFYRQVVEDPMIGFLFTGVSIERLVELEVQLAARLFGADVPYEGRPMREAHAASPIRWGHFTRRQRLLEEAMARADLPEPVRRAWLEHNERLAPLVVAGAC